MTTSPILIKYNEFSKTKPKIIMRLKGGLGNQFFQYALGRHLANLNNAILFLDITTLKKVKTPNKNLGKRILGIHHFNIKANLVEYGLNGKNIHTPIQHFTSEILRKIEKRIPYYHRRHIPELYKNTFYFDPKIYKLRFKKAKYLKGYWQTEKYFFGLADEIRNELTVKITPDINNQEYIDHINSVNSISLHVRNTDNVETQLGILSKTYYQTAIDLIKSKIQNPVFFIFSDNIPYARKLFTKQRNFNFVNINNDLKNYEDIRLMTNCKHHIIANSSFSWWGAWLAFQQSQIVIAPKRYQQIGKRNTPDYYPSHWILI